MDIDGMVQAVLSYCEESTYTRSGQKALTPLGECGEIAENANEVLFLLKPEVFRPGVHSAQLTRDILNKLACFGAEVRAATLVNSKFIKMNSIVERQYRMICLGAILGRGVLGNRFQNHGQSKIVGAYPFLEEFPDLSARALEEIAHSEGSRKVSNGIYVLDYDHKGESYEIINAFHPFQAEHFQDHRSMLLALLCRFDMSMSEIAEMVSGFFVPARATKGSIRRSVFDRRDQFNMNVSTMFNVIHSSPSPLEAMFSSALYFSSPESSRPGIERTAFWRGLKQSGFSDIEINNLQLNPIVEWNGGQDYLYSLLEGINSAECLRILGHLFNK